MVGVPLIVSVLNVIPFVADFASRYEGNVSDFVSLAAILISFLVVHDAELLAV